MSKAKQRSRVEASGESNNAVDVARKEAATQIERRDLANAIGARGPGKLSAADTANPARLAEKLDMRTLARALRVAISAAITERDHMLEGDWPAMLVRTRPIGALSDALDLLDAPDDNWYADEIENLEAAGCAHPGETIDDATRRILAQSMSPADAARLVRGGHEKRVERGLVADRTAARARVTALAAKAASWQNNARSDLDADATDAGVGAHLRRTTRDAYTAAIDRENALADQLDPRAGRRRKGRKRGGRSVKP